MFSKFLENIKNIPYGVYDGLSVISSIVTIVTAIIGVKNAVADIKEIDGSYVISVNKILVYGLIITVCILIVVCIKLRKYAILLRNQRKKLAINYYNAAHDLRNTYFDILQRHKENLDADAGLKIKNLTNDTRCFLENSLDYLCEILESLTGREIHGCIKLIENANGASRKINIKKATVKTFCRSKNTQAERKSDDNPGNKSVRIIDNTDFYDILDPENTNMDSYFYQSNLIEYEKKLEASGKEYKNSTKKWKDYYRSTIVAPIRVANERLFFNNLKIGYDVIGFVCVDSMAPDAFRNRESDKENFSCIVKSFSAEVYIILNMYSYYLRKLKGELKNEQTSRKNG